MKRTSEIAKDLLNEREINSLVESWNEQVKKSIDKIKDDYILSKLVIKGIGLIDTNWQGESKIFDCVFKHLYSCDINIDDKYSVKSYKNSNLDEIRKRFLDNEMRK